MENQLKATGLRWGNIIEYLTDEGDVLETTIDWQDIKWISEDETGFNLVHSPIPLSEEILIKLGFEEKYFGILQKGILSFNKSSLSPFISNEYGNLAIKKNTIFVHQLQNFYFSLTGEELTFKK